MQQINNKVKRWFLFAKVCLIETELVVKGKCANHYTLFLIDLFVEQ